jgi:hypothetical protein
VKIVVVCGGWRLLEWWFRLVRVEEKLVRGG